MTTNDSDNTDLLGAATDTPAMLLVDQKRRWLQGERVLVEEYCRQLPSLRNDTESLLDLIYSEVLLRERRGEQPTLAEYVERFPDVADQLRIQFELDQVINSSDMITERSGSVIGRYTLLEQLGEGGMGVVYVAQQDRPVARQVALKIIKPGMDTKEVITRFEAERQALALMDHSNIARVFDAGQPTSGRPYFVMELVRGTPITEYCDQNHLTIDKRLELFVQVCHAVQHAHQKGIIHRDLKPSNVLIAQHDGRGVPKMIDFGLAKATGQQLTEKTLLTAFPQMMGTPHLHEPRAGGDDQPSTSTPARTFIPWACCCTSYLPARRHLIRSRFRAAASTRSVASSARRNHRAPARGSACRARRARPRRPTAGRIPPAAATR